MPTSKGDLHIIQNRRAYRMIFRESHRDAELCRAIREFDSHTPILFYSPAAHSEDVRLGLEAGAQACLVKPFLPDELRQTIAQLIFAR